MAGILTSLPQWLANALGTDWTTAALLLSCAILISVAMVIALIGKKMNMIATAIPMMTVMGFLVTIAWMPYWILLVMAVLVAMWLGIKMKGWLS